ncbi:DUF6520 family protein [Flavivirga eckloniae]|uniref:Kazal-like domain-containing protein n=1 Tax=Flavivirga eckloniae TaxID=1803846 RepID=A0A2K9PNR4_9FLAO|nr:DUF6520 family protein [Flavivirga eckloniae]AUP78711.1 hypothetical protein C1H87_08320 [Flavivirga eckloniae]
MKSIFFKFALPVFALIIAITTSLAFAPNVSEEAPIDVYYKDKDTDECICVTIDDSFIPNCNVINTGPVCTIFVFGQGAAFLFADANCTLHLRKP